MQLTDEQKRAIMVAMYEKCDAAAQQRLFIKERVAQMRKVRDDLLLAQEVR